MIGWKTKWRPDLDSACPKTPMTTIFPTKSKIWNFAKKLPTLGMQYKAIHDPEPIQPEGLLPDLTDPTRGIDTSLLKADYDKTWQEKYLAY